MNYQQAHFLVSAARLSQAPEDVGVEVAFAGRSNAGKSSAINAITNIGGLARTSKTPGRTQLMNFFNLDDQHRLVDLPGYGYAKVAESVKRRWQAELSHYLHARQSLVGLILLMDIRHPLKEFDLQMLQWCQQRDLARISHHPSTADADLSDLTGRFPSSRLDVVSAMPSSSSGPSTSSDRRLDALVTKGGEKCGLAVHILLTKSDKLKRGQATRALAIVREYIEAHLEDTTVQLFSATKRVGVDEVRRHLDGWFN